MDGSQDLGEQGVAGLSLARPRWAAIDHLRLEPRFVNVWSLSVDQQEIRLGVSGVGPGAE